MLGQTWLRRASTAPSRLSECIPLASAPVCRCFKIPHFRTLFISLSEQHLPVWLSSHVFEAASDMWHLLSFSGKMIDRRNESVVLIKDMAYWYLLNFSRILFRVKAKKWQCLLKLSGCSPAALPGPFPTFCMVIRNSWLVSSSRFPGRSTLQAMFPSKHGDF